MAGVRETNHGGPFEDQLHGRIQDLEEKLAAAEREASRWQARVLKLEARLSNVRAAINND